MLSLDFAKKHQVLLVYEGQEWLLVHVHALSLPLLCELRRATGAPFKQKSVTQHEFDALLVGHYQTSSSGVQSLADGLDAELDLNSMANKLCEAEDLLANNDEAPIIRLINATLSQAIKERASDLHIEPYAENIIIRFRIDGVLHERLSLNPSVAPLLVSRIKVMAKLDIAEKRVPQDGRMALLLGGQEIDVRVSTMPSSFGERVVLRILEKHLSALGLDKLGMGATNLERMQGLISRPHGIILVTGPTGSGKTTTLYAALNALNKPSRNILTVEDPVEYQLPGVGQTQVNNKVAMTFAKGLRAILRQDPDVVMVGEIRDLETAQIAIQASLTGHLVLSTLHTNTPIGALTRLRDIGVEPFLLATSLLGVVGQRLVRTLCPACGSHTGQDGLVDTLNLEPKGCDACNYIGYLGRTGIYELVVIDQQLKDMINDGASEGEITQVVRKSAPSMHEDGLQKVKRGLTTRAEIERVTTVD